MPPAKPSLELLRSLTDEHVLRALMRQRRLTRAELATATGLSKPTVGESVRRLAAAGLVADTGERTPGGRGKGRVGSYYALAGGLGLALAVSIAPDGIVAECVDAYGDTICRVAEPVARPARAEHVGVALAAAGRAAQAAAARAQPGAGTQSQPGAGTALRLAAVSAADPVDRASGRLIHLPGSPFLLGELDPAAVLAGQVTGPVVVDNDVNWAARAERDHAGGGLDHFAYLFLGEGIGCAIVSDGQVSRGQHGLAGEAAHLITVGPRGRAMPLIEVFGELGLRQPGSTAVDTARLLAAFSGTNDAAARVRATLGPALGGVLTAIATLTDPELIVTGGPWGSHPAVLAAVTATAAGGLPWPVPVRAAALAGDAALAGVRADALTRLRDDIIATAR